MIYCCIFYKPISKHHKLQHGQHACIHVASHLHNKSTNFTWKNFNNHIRHPFIKPHLRIRIPSTIIWYINIHMNISLIYSILQFICACIQPDTNTQNMWHTSITINHYVYVIYTHTHENFNPKYMHDILQPWTWVLMWPWDLTTFKYKLRYLPKWFKLTLILPRSRTGTVWFYTSTSNKRAAQPKLYTNSLTRDLKLMYSRLTLVRISIKL